jgi:hypothetical protein
MQIPWWDCRSNAMKRRLSSHSSASTLRSVGDIARHQRLKDNDALYVSPRDMPPIPTVRDLRRIASDDYRRYCMDTTQRSARAVRFLDARDLRSAFRASPARCHRRSPGL